MEFNATFLASIISFLIFVLIMNWIFYRPLAKISDERKVFIDGNYKDAKDAQDKAEQIILDNELKKNNAYAQAKDILVEKSEDAKKQKSLSTSEAKNKSLETIKEAKSKLLHDRESSSSVLEGSVSDLADIICEKLNGSR